MRFPKKFTWGAAAASYQIEGAPTEDGKGPSVWDMYCRQPGKVWDGDTGDVACDHYHRYEEDARLMGEIGLQAYRMSVSWPRVLPAGTGAVNEKGLAFYDRLVDRLLEQNVEPWVTLFHWDFPYDLFCRGGWLNRRSAEWFAEYAQHVVERLSDRVSHWITLNEPQCFIDYGHRTGTQAPGLKLGLQEVLLAAHHSLLAHGRAVQVIRAHAKTPPTVGIAPVGALTLPATDDPGDVACARDDTFSVTGRNCESQTWFADPMVLGHYPEDGLRLFGKEMPTVPASDLETIHQPLDFFGVNIYGGYRVRQGADGQPEPVPNAPGPELTAMEWGVQPDALYWGPRFLHERYQLPMVVTENGMANIDWVDDDGQVRDPQRINFLKRHLRAYRRAIEDGVEALGYFHWSIMDNFEWSFGHKRRFGFIHVDYETQQRTLKESARWYAEVIRSHGASL